MTTIPPNHRKWIENLNKPVVGLSKEQLEYKYVQMFLEKNIPSTAEWEECLVKIIQHPSYKLLPTLEERKHFFFKRYIPIRKELEVELAWIEEERSILALKRFCLTSPLISDFSPLKGEKEYARLVEKELLKTFPIILQIDPRTILDTLRERWSLYENTKKTQREKLYPKMMKEISSSSLKPSDLTYSFFKNETFPKLYSGREEEYSLFFVGKYSDHIIDWIEVVRFWSTYIKEVIVKEEDRKQMLEKVQRNSISRRNRKEFTSLLQEVKPKSWKDLLSTAKEDPRFLNMIGQSTGSNALSLYWDYIDGVSVGDDDSNISTTSTTNTTAIESKETNQCCQTTKSYKEMNKEKISRLKDLLKNGPFEIDYRKTTFEEYSSSPLISELPQWTDVKDTSIKREYFAKYIAYLTEKNATSFLDSKEDGEI